ncbi:hypothetical protein FRC00_007416 [Tulasnella sp. 408]|nr:hypothetical protein FRC00_007416 [Tulasnella sp. 408]
MKYILSTGFNDFEKGPQSIMRFGSFLGTGIFASDGDRAKSHRAIARPYFARERISDYECFSRHTEKLLAIIQAHSSSDTPLDVQDVFARFTMDAAEEFLFGNHDFATLDLPLPKPGQTEEGAKGSVLEGVFGRFVQAFEQGQMNAVNRLGKGNYGWTITEFFSDKQMPIVKTMEEYLEPLAAAAIKRKKEREAKGEKESKEHESFLDHLVASTDDVTLIKDQLRNILLAARDTTAQLLSFTCYCLALKPEIMDRLRQEILSAYGDSTIPTYDDLKKQKYLRAVLDETLRLFPPVPVNVRHSKHDVVIPTREGGLYIPRGDFTCIYSTVSIQRRKDLWGDDAEEFNPERWIDPERARKIASDPFMFLPFNGGPRICLGQVRLSSLASRSLYTDVLLFLVKQFAYNEASFVLVRILQKFSRITLAQDEAAPASALPPASWKEAKGRKRIEKVWPKTALTLYSKTMTNLSPSSSQPGAARKELISADGARAVALFILVEAASVTMTLMTDYVEGDLEYRQPYFIVYASQSCLSFLIPLHLAYLSWKTKVPASRYIVELKHTLAQQFPKSDSPGINYRSLTRTVFISATGFTAMSVLWYLCVIFAPISDATAIWSTNAFWTYIFSVLASSPYISSNGGEVQKWEFRKLFAVSMASVGVAAVAYGGSNQTQQTTSPESPKLALLGDALALASALTSAIWAVWYDRSIALPEGEHSRSRPPSPPPSNIIDGPHADFQPLRTDDERTPLIGETTPITQLPYSLPFGLHANFFSWTVGMITLLFFWIPLYFINIMKLGPPVELPPNAKVWLYVGLISVLTVIYDAGSMVLFYLWGPVLTAVAGLLTIVLVLGGDALFGKGMQTITAETLLGSTMIVGAFALLARDAMKPTEIA